ncbi:hypothetical protein H0H93_002504 [Arthromyces matolae]|nr:hypothetical protein H0H93_002504 [Arthromyces matolae]
MSTRKPISANIRKSATPSQAGRRQRPVEKENQPVVPQRGARERRVSAKVAEQLQERAEAEARRNELTSRREARLRKSQVKRDKAAGITQDANDTDLQENPDTVFTSRKVTSKPAERAASRPNATFASAPTPTPIKRSSKVPSAPLNHFSRAVTEEPDVEDNISANDHDMSEDNYDDTHDDLGDFYSDKEDEYNEGDFDQDADYAELEHDREPIDDSNRIYDGGFINDAFVCGAPLSEVVRRHPAPKPLPKPLPGHMVLNLRTPTPELSNKRPRSNSLEHAVVAPKTVKAIKIVTNSRRPKASDYDDVAKQVILTAGNVYRCLISTSNGFPDSGTEIEFVCEAWKHANEIAKLNPPLDMTPDIGKIIKQRGSQLRGEVKSKTASMIETMYGFSSAQGRRNIAANRDLAELLKLEKGFLYKELTSDARKGIYRHPIIQTAVNKVWFTNTRDEGVVFTDMFNPMPIPAIALILTAIECNIDEWTTGLKTDKAFYADDYRATYLKHIESLETFGKATAKHDMLKTMQKRLHNFGRQHAGATPVALTNDPAIPMSAFIAALKEYEEDDDETDEDGEIAVFPDLPIVE